MDRGHLGPRPLRSHTTRPALRKYLNLLGNRGSASGYGTPSPGLVGQPGDTHPHPGTISMRPLCYGCANGPCRPPYGIIVSAYVGTCGVEGPFFCLCVSRSQSMPWEFVTAPAAIVTGDDALLA